MENIDWIAGSLLSLLLPWTFQFQKVAWLSNLLHVRHSAWHKNLFLTFHQFLINSTTVCYMVWELKFSKQYHRNTALHFYLKKHLIVTQLFLPDAVCKLKGHCFTKTKINLTQKYLIYYKNATIKIKFLNSYK